MNTEQIHAEFEAWWREEMSPRITGNGPLLRKISWYVWQARAALQHSCKEISQDAEYAGMAEIVREAAQIIAAIPPEHAPDNIRWPIVDELEGFASKIDHARRVEGEGR